MLLNDATTNMRGARRTIPAPLNQFQRHQDEAAEFATQRYFDAAPWQSYNCESPFVLLEELLSCHWLEGTTLQFCVTQLVAEPWPPSGPPPMPPDRKKRTVPSATSCSSLLVVRIGSLPLKPPIAITGRLVSRIIESA